MARKELTSHRRPVGLNHPDRRGILGNKMKEGKVILLHGFDREEIAKILKAVKSVADDPKAIAFAMSTPTNLEWKIRDFIDDVRGDHEYLQKNPPNPPRRRDQPPFDSGKV